MPPAWLNVVVLAILLLVVVVVLILFVDTWRRRQGSTAEGWNRINAGIVVVLLFAIGTAIAQMFLEGRTEFGCRILHHVSATLSNTGASLVKVLFIARLLEVNKLPNKWETVLDRGLLATTFLYWILGITWLNATLRTAVVENACIVILDPTGAAFSLLIPQFIDVVTNVRLWQVLQVVKSRPGVKLLVATTFASCLTSDIINVFSVLIMMQIIPLDPSLITIWLTFELAFDACSTALPTIIVRFARRPDEGRTSWARIQILPSRHPPKPHEMHPQTPNG
ncbi:Uncharacterized protein PBTT_01169 [Plasmodiophora brassicae]|uniref:Uncharacterized protein n=1 Tax=Plasmodiophora brassicae TaxID=37360 RepID=A0A3P3Y1I9_PLABS|nr:unnamed protein product [Plasmodiophora brassicae]